MGQGSATKKKNPGDFAKGHDPRRHVGPKSTSFKPGEDSRKHTPLKKETLLRLNKVIDEHGPAVIEEALAKGTLHGKPLDPEQIIEILKWGAGFTMGSMKDRTEASIAQAGLAFKPPDQMTRLELSQHIEQLPQQGEAVVIDNEGAPVVPPVSGSQERST